MVEASYHRFRASTVPGIVPVDGHELLCSIDGTSELFSDRTYIARTESRDVILSVSRSWEPTQEQFAWLVQHGALRTGFVTRTGARTSWSNATIDAAMALEPRELVA